MVLIGNHTGRALMQLAEQYGWMGHLYSPGAWHASASLPYALDNGAYSQWARGETFNGDAYRRLLDVAANSGRRPLWALVPDAVGDRDGTLRLWDEWNTIVGDYCWPLAFAVQDGMTVDDVPTEASVVFVGGSTTWKLRTMHAWCCSYARVHVARVNTWRRLWAAYDAGAESIDGTGWYHHQQADHLRDFLMYRDGQCGRPYYAGMDLYAKRVLR